MTSFHSVRINGSVSFWDVGAADFYECKAAFESTGLGNFAPKKRTDTASLRSALSDYCRTYEEGRDLDSKKRRRLATRHTVQARKKPRQNGYEVVRIVPDEAMNDVRQTLAARINGGSVEITMGTADPERLAQLIAAARDVALPGSIGAALVKVATEHFSGVELGRKVYWLPDDALPAWRQLAKGLAEASALVQHVTQIHEYRFVFDDCSTRSLRNAIIRTITESVERIKEDVAAGELGTRALQRREEAARELHATISHYEHLLSDTLQHLHLAADAAQQAAAAAVASQQAQDTFAGMFA